MDGDHYAQSMDLDKLSNRNGSSLQSNTELSSPTATPSIIAGRSPTLSQGHAGQSVSAPYRPQTPNGKAGIRPVSQVKSSPRRPSKNIKNSRSTPKASADEAQEHLCFSKFKKKLKNAFSGGGGGGVGGGAASKRKKKKRNETDYSDSDSLGDPEAAKERRSLVLVAQAGRGSNRMSGGQGLGNASNGKQPPTKKPETLEEVKDEERRMMRRDADKQKWSCCLKTNRRRSQMAGSDQSIDTKIAGSENELAGASTKNKRNSRLTTAGGKQNQQRTGPNGGNRAKSKRSNQTVGRKNSARLNRQMQMTSSRGVSGKEKQLLGRLGGSGNSKISMQLSGSGSGSGSGGSGFSFSGSGSGGSNTKESRQTRHVTGANNIKQNYQTGRNKAK